MSSSTNRADFGHAAEIVAKQVVQALDKLAEKETRFDIETLIELKAALGALDTLVSNWALLYNNFIKRGRYEIE